MGHFGLHSCCRHRCRRLRCCCCRHRCCRRRRRRRRRPPPACRCCVFMVLLPAVAACHTKAHAQAGTCMLRRTGGHVSAQAHRWAAAAAVAGARVDGGGGGGGGGGGSQAGRWAVVQACSIQLFGHTCHIARRLYTPYSCSCGFRSQSRGSQTYQRRQRSSSAHAKV